jgi:hypothetical protein
MDSENHGLPGKQSIEGEKTSIAGKMTKIRKDGSSGLKYELAALMAQGKVLPQE